MKRRGFRDTSHHADPKAEFAFHLESSALDLEREGIAPELARREAERRFGDLDRLEFLCRREAPETFPETLMARTTRWLMLGSLLVLAVGIVFLGRQIAHQRTLIDGLERQLASVAPPADQHALLDHGVVSIDGAVARPGVYALPPSGVLTATRLLTASGAPSQPLQVFVFPRQRTAERTEAWRAAGRNVVDHKGRPCLVYLRDASDGAPEDGPALSADDDIWVLAK